MKAVKVSVSHEEFEKLFEERVQKCKSVLVKKSKEYAPGEDKMHNFNEAARILNTTPEKIAFMYMMKHFQSFMDIVMNNREVTEDVWDEKLGDLINYLFLIDAMWKKRHRGNKVNGTQTGKAPENSTERYDQSG